MEKATEGWKRWKVDERCGSSWVFWSSSRGPQLAFFDWGARRHENMMGANQHEESMSFNCWTHHEAFSSLRLKTGKQLICKT